MKDFSTFALMRIALAIGCSILICMGSTMEGWKYFYFLWQQDYLTEEICIYRNDPESMCAASCFLQDQLSSDQNQSSFPTLANGQISTDFLLYAPEEAQVELGYDDNTALHTSFTYYLETGSLYYQEIPIPPWTRIRISKS